MKLSYSQRGLQEYLGSAIVEGEYYNISVLYAHEPFQFRDSKKKKKDLQVKWNQNLLHWSRVKETTVEVEPNYTRGK